MWYEGDMKLRFLIAACIGFLLTACGPKADLKPVQQQKSGEYTVTILNETGSLKQGQNNFTVEFRKTADNQLVDVGTVDVAPVMEMPPMSPMMGSTQVTPSGTAGKYNVTGNFSMAGLWKCKVTFGNGQSVRFNLSAE